MELTTVTNNFEQAHAQQDSDHADEALCQK